MGHVPVRIYVSGSEPDRVAVAMNRVRQIGYEVVFDWPAARRAADAANDDSPSQTAAEIEERLRSADVVLVLAPKAGHYFPGAFFEAGLAAGLGKSVVVAGARARSALIAHKTAYFKYTRGALEHLYARAHGGAALPQSLRDEWWPARPAGSTPSP